MESIIHLGGGLQATFMALPVATAETADPVIQASYRKLVGLFIWLYRTRPDFMFVCNLLSRNLHNSILSWRQVVRFDTSRGQELVV